jgi:hypothetical protein
MDTDAPDLASLKAALWDKAKRSTDPPDKDELLRTIYRTPEIRGDIVLAGKQTRTLYPITNRHEYRVHFLKTNLGDPELDTRQEYVNHLQIYESWKSQRANSSDPIPLPRPLAYGPTTFRSELIFGVTLAALTPCRIKKGHPPKDLDDWLQTLSPLKTIPLKWQKKYWDGLTALSLAIYQFQNLNHVAHKDLHKDNLMLVPCARDKKTSEHPGETEYRPVLIDFETAQFEPQPHEQRADYYYLLHEARLLLAGPLREDPNIRTSQLAQIALQQAHHAFSAFDLTCLEKAEQILQTRNINPAAKTQKPAKQRAIWH